jgi:alcohol dehydrogenase (cytochrome c)
MKKGSVCVVFACLGVATLFAKTTRELVNDGRNTDNMLTMGMGYDRKNYSPLGQINTFNVKRLVPIWATSVMNDLGELAAPVVYNGVMYVINGKWTFALDVGTGRQIWRTPVTLEAGARGSSITRGAPAIYNGKLFRITADNHLVALDMKTGDELWNQKFAESKEGYSATAAPMVADGVVISGMAGGDSTTRGFLDGWDPETGKKLWRRYTIPAPGEPGSATWPKNGDVWKRGGGPTWLTGSYAPELDLVYWGTGNPSPYDPHPREGMDSLFSSSVLALRPKTGEVACYFQYTPNDVFDADGNDQQVLADIQVGGRPRKVMMQTNKSGFLYTLDRTELLADCGPPVYAYELGDGRRHENRATDLDRPLQAFS